MILQSFENNSSSSRISSRLQSIYVTSRSQTERTLIFYRLKLAPSVRQDIEAANDTLSRDYKPSESSFLALRRNLQLPLTPTPASLTCVSVRDRASFAKPVTFLCHPPSSPFSTVVRINVRATPSVVARVRRGAPGVHARAACVGWHARWGGQ